MSIQKADSQKDTISIRGDRDKWLDFIYMCKKKKKQVWEVLEPCIDKFLKEN